MYRAWQTGKNSTPEEISLAVQNFINKFGFPPSVLEVSDKLPTVESLATGEKFYLCETEQGIVATKMVVSAVRIPKNIMLVGSEESEVEHETI